ncbi:MAG: thiopeptide-type bacteriocin biosynthesis protein, partial [Bacteroidota bacterium]
MSKSPQRSFIPGDEWLYYKIYTGPKTADKILVNIIKPAVENLQKNGTINRWFFLRYADPKHHLRLRLHCPKTENIVAVLETLTITLSDLLSEDLIWKVQLDTYQREIERYGSNSITLAEEVFFQDSILVTNFLALANQYNSPNLRWLFSLRAIDSYLNDFGYSDERKRDLLEKMKVGFRSEFDNTRILGKQLDKKYRTNQKDI